MLALEGVSRLRSFLLKVVQLLQHTYPFNFITIVVVCVVVAAAVIVTEANALQKNLNQFFLQSLVFFSFLKYLFKVLTKIIHKENQY